MRGSRLSDLELEPAVVCSFDFKSFSLSVLIWLHPAFYALFAFFCLFIFFAIFFVCFGICLFDFFYLSLFSCWCCNVFERQRWSLFFRFYVCLFLFIFLFGFYICLLVYFFFCYFSAPVFLLHPAFHLWLPSTCRSLRPQDQPSYCSTRGSSTENHW